MKKSAQVVMLPTNEKANITIVGSELTWSVIGKVRENNEGYHLYILSDEEIKEGDYHVAIRIVKTNGDKAIAFTDQEQLDAIAEIGGAKKIIATTDSNLTIKTLLFVQGENKEIDVLLPQLSQSFIEKFVEEYNKGNVITDVMVEYEYDSYSTKTDGKLTADFKLKINPKDNTINISKSKKSWNREEVVELLYKHTEYMLSGKKDTLDKWIEENL